MAREPILRVAVDTPVPTLFDYLPPKTANGELEPGLRLTVPFGRRQVTGVLAAVVSQPTIDRLRLKRAVAILDEEPVLSPGLIEMLSWAAAYYHHPPGEVFATALPAGLRRGQPQTVTTEFWFVTEAGLAQDDDALARRAPRQAELLMWLRTHAAGATYEDIADAVGDCRAQLRCLRSKSFIASRTAVCDPVACPGEGSTEAPRPTPSQQKIIDAFSKDRERFSTFLINGVTGSGKTEVYLRIIEDVTARSTQALVLVPEIGLTPQLVDRFRRRLKVPMTVLHSGLTDRERLDAWRLARNGTASVVIGTRSAVFAPLPDPGVIIVDEEHDSSYKQQDGFRYHARDLAVRRGQKAHIPVILGSATPSLESLHNAARGRYRTFDLTQRPGQAKPPDISVVDLRGHAVDKGFSTPLILKMQQHIDRGGQVLLFLNRRGYARALFCAACGWVAMCPRCDARMILHQGRGVLRCHHCGREQAPITACGDCSASLIAVGQGTEKIEETLADKFPDIPLGRIDRDTMHRKGARRAFIDDVLSGRIRLLIGTQMLTKGHHFPEVSLVGVINADHGLFGTDFRSDERLAQTIIQVAGRAGRAERPGEVLVQTSYPEHPLLKRLISEGYEGFAAAALNERRQAGWPPFSHLALIRTECATRDPGYQLLNEVRLAMEPTCPTGVRLLGPAAAPMERRAGRFRAQLLIQAAERGPLHTLLDELVPMIAGLPDARRVRWSIDVDPIELF